MKNVCIFLVSLAIFWLISFSLSVPSRAFDGYGKVKKAGVLRHIGVPYARFVTGSGDGLDVELIRMFATHLGVKYVFVQSSWKHHMDDVGLGLKGDVIANGLTILPWREEQVLFSIPTFPSGVWLISNANSVMEPIIPSGDQSIDIQNTIEELRGHTVLALQGGCLDPSLNRITGTGAEIKLVSQNVNLNDLVPLVLEGKAESTLLDVPDALIAIQKWPGKIKVIGPLSQQQVMGVAFNKESRKLRDDFNSFFLENVRNGIYQRLVDKYYPSIGHYYPLFFSQLTTAAGKKPISIKW